MNKISGALLLMSVSACSLDSNIQPYVDDEQALRDGLPPTSLLADRTGDTTSVEQALAAKPSATLQYGTRTASSGRACDRTSSGQVCYVPAGTGLTGTVSSKAITWRLTPVHGFSSEEQTAIQNAVVALDNSLANWTFNFTTQPAGAIQLANAPVSGGSGSSNIDAFVETQFLIPQQLNEQTGVVGQYISSPSCFISLDIADINARGTAEGGATEIGKLRTHAILVGLMRCLGLGTRDDAGSAGFYIDRTLVFPGPVFRLLLTAGDQCRANSYDPFSNIFDFSNLKTVCSD
jgi:hypothetical protein